MIMMMMTMMMIAGGREYGDILDSTLWFWNRKKDTEFLF